MNKGYEKLKEGLKDFEETSEIRFVIEDYNDIFSNFDPRPLPKRGLSENFLAEAKRASIVKEAEKVDCIFLVPRKVRDFKGEVKIIERLQKYFKKHFNLLKNEKNKTIKKGTLFIASGIIVMLLATFLLFNFKQESFLTSFFVSIFFIFLASLLRILIFPLLKIISFFPKGFLLPVFSLLISSITSLINLFEIIEFSSFW